MLQRSIDEVVSASPPLRWAVSIRDLAGSELAGVNRGRVMRTASVGKLLLLVEAARQCATGELSTSTFLSRDSVPHVADSGLWQHLCIDALSVGDLCVLIASVSDNLATNVLLDRIGLASVGLLSASLGLGHTALHDCVRDLRGPDDPATLSSGSASELSDLMCRLSRNDVVSAAVSQQVKTWLATGVDLSMVGGAFGLDPLAHNASGHKTTVCHKTGSDPGVRADIGIAGHGTRLLSYAAVVNWDAADDSLCDMAIAGMRAIGLALRATLERSER